MKKYLVALDGSVRSPEVLAQAVSLARSTSAKLVLFRSFGIPPEATLAWPLSEEPLEATLRREAQTYLAAMESGVPSEVPRTVRAELGLPWRAVCSVAREENVDMVIIGSHGYSGIDYLLGTTAAKIVNHADRPVLVVRPIPAAP